MSDKRQQLLYDDSSVPDHASVLKLSSYFLIKYDLDDTQVGGLVVSSARSLNEFISRSNSLLEEYGENLEYEHIRGVLHSGVGIFRTMGCEKWANYLNKLSQSSASTLYINFQTVIQQIQESFSDIIATA